MRTSRYVLAMTGAYLWYWLLSLGPVAVAVALDWDVYTASAARCVSLSVAGVLAVTLVALQMAGRAPKRVKRVVWYALVAAALWLLTPIVQSLAVLVTCMAVGEGAAMLLAAPVIRRLRRMREDRRLADVVGAAVAEAQGRV